MRRSFGFWLFMIRWGPGHRAPDTSKQTVRGTRWDAVGVRQLTTDQHIVRKRNGVVINFLSTELCMVSEWNKDYMGSTPVFMVLEWNKDCMKSSKGSCPLQFSWCRNGVRSAWGHQKVPFHSSFHGARKEWGLNDVIIPFLSTPICMKPKWDRNCMVVIIRLLSTPDYMVPEWNKDYIGLSCGSCPL